VITLQLAVFLLYAVTAASLFAVLVPGYLAWLRWGRRRRAAPGPLPLASSLPEVDVIVPVYNEGEFIERKLENLAALVYPRGRIRLLIVDGASTDATWALAVARGSGDPRFTLIGLDTADKTRQLNAGLRCAHGSWVVVTDADARLAPDTLERLIAVGEADPSVSVVGAMVTPERAHPLERLHWRISNAIRRHESERGAASHVAGPCYAFRRRLVDQFPEDVVADDIYVALAAAASGRRTVLADVVVTEQRSPVALPELFRHKLRKTDAYLREIFRFLPRASAMPSPARAIFLWRAAHLTVLPVLVALGVLGAALALSPDVLPARLHLVLAAAAGVLLLASVWGLARRASPLLVLAHGILLAAVTLWALVAYPFSRQTASFPKVTGSTSGKRGSA
jgi:glycosyltransferase involved in cell wall biosynthesis